MRLILLLLFLSACSGGAPTIYGQGIPVAPSAPAFSPTLDAPITVGQPGYVGPVENLPRGENKRVLPPTREPGIWASKPSDDYAAPMILMVPLPVPESAQTPLDYESVSMCGKIMDSLIARNDITKSAWALSDDARRCVAARLYRACAEEFFASLQQARPSLPTVPLDQERALRAMRTTAKDFETKTCKGVSSRPADELYALVHLLFRKEVHGP